MRRILSLLAVPLAAAALLGAGCGGGGGGDKSTGGGSTGTSQAPSGDAAAILSSIKPTAPQGTQKIGLNLDVGLKGTIKDPSVSALLGSGPITLDLSGPVDAAGKKADLTFDLKAGKINLKGGLRVLADKAYIQLADKWYELPLQQAQSGAAANLDPNKVLEAIGDPSALVKNATVVGVEDVDGIATDHVAGDVDTTELVKAIARVAKQFDSSTTTPIDADQIAKATAQIEKYVKSAKVDVWVGQQSKQVNKFKLAVDAVLDESTKASSGLDGFTAALTVSATPTDTPDVTKPDGALPASQLQTDIGPIILGGLGGATP